MGDRPIFLHFLDREFQECVGMPTKQFSQGHLNRLDLFIKVALLLTRMELIISPSSLVESIYTFKLANRWKNLLKKGRIRVALKEPNLDIFFEKKQQQFREAKIQYPTYFNIKVRNQIEGLEPTFISRSTNIGKSIDRYWLSELRRTGITSWMTNIEGKWAKEKPRIIEEILTTIPERRENKPFLWPVIANTVKDFGLTKAAIFQIRLRITKFFIQCYLYEYDATILSGLPFGRVEFDDLSTPWPFYDFDLFLTIFKTFKPSGIFLEDIEPYHIEEIRHSDEYSTFLEIYGHWLNINISEIKILTDTNLTRYAKLAKLKRKLFNILAFTKSSHVMNGRIVETVKAIFLEICLKLEKIYPQFVIPNIFILPKDKLSQEEKLTMKRNWLKALGHATTSIAGPFGAPLAFSLSLYEDEKEEQRNLRIEHLLLQSSTINKKVLEEILELRESSQNTHEELLTLINSILEAIKPEASVSIDNAYKLLDAKEVKLKDKFSLTEKNIIDELCNLFAKDIKLFLTIIDESGFPIKEIDSSGSPEVMIHSFATICRGLDRDLLKKVFNHLYERRKGSSVLKRATKLLNELNEAPTNK